MTDSGLRVITLVLSEAEYQALKRDCQSERGQSEDGHIAEHVLSIIDFAIPSFAAAGEEDAD